MGDTLVWVAGGVARVWATIALVTATRGRVNFQVCVPVSSKTVTTVSTSGQPASRQAVSATVTTVSAGSFKISAVQRLIAAVCDGSISRVVGEAGSG